jgi:hypothetical protein
MLRRITRGPMSTNDEADAGTLCMEARRPRGRVQPEPGRSWSGDWVRRDWRADALIRLEQRSALSGEESAVYRTTGSSWEHGNLDRGAEPAKLGKPPSPAMSSTRGRAFVVVRAQESCAHGEGRQ